MTTAVACAVLALISWLVYGSGGGYDAALVFAIVWTAMAVAYAPRAWRSRRAA